MACDDELRVELDFVDQAAVACCWWEIFGVVQEKGNWLLVSGRSPPSIQISLDDWMLLLDPIWSLKVSW